MADFGRDLVAFSALMMIFAAVQVDNVYFGVKKRLKRGDFGARTD